MGGNRARACAARIESPKLRKLIQKLLGWPNHWQYGTSTSPGTNVDGQTFGVHDVPALLRMSDIVSSSASWLARNACTAVLVVSDDESDFDDHPLLDLLESPNPLHTFEQLTLAIITDYLTIGNAVIVKERSGTLKPIALHYAPWEDVSLQPGGQYLIRGIRYDAEDVIHFRHGISRIDRRYGFGPLENLFIEVLTDREAAQYSVALLRNLGRLGLVGMPDGDYSVSEDSARVIERRLTEMSTGSRRGSTLFLSAPMKLEHLGFPPSDMELGRLREIPEERICAALGVSPGVLGLGAGLSNSRIGATMKEMRRISWEEGVIPLQDALAATLSATLMPEFEANPERLRLAWDRSEVSELRQDENELVRRADTLYRSKILMLSEVREMLGYETAPADEGWYGESRAGDAEEENEEAQEEGADEEGSENPFEKQRKASPVSPAMLVDFERRLEYALEELGDAVAEEYERNPEADEDAILLAIGFALLAEQTLRPLYEDQYAAVVRLAFGSFDDQFGIYVQRNADRIAEIIREGGTRMGLLDLDEQARRALRDAIARGVEEGLEAAEIADDIRDRVPRGRFRDPRTRARLIARTEIKFAENKATIEYARSSDGVVMLRARDNQTGYNDEECTDRDGRIFTPMDAERQLVREHPNGTLEFEPIIG